MGVSSLSVIVRFSIGGRSSTAISLRVRGPERFRSAFCSSSSSESSSISVLNEKMHGFNLQKSKEALIIFHLFLLIIFRLKRFV